MSSEQVKEPSTIQAIQDLITQCGGDPTTFDSQLVTEMIQTGLRLLFEGHDTGQIKLMTRTIKELRYAYNIFNQFAGVRRISIFGSARTAPDHPDYVKARAFSAGLAQRGWMTITGAAEGIMKAGLEGASRASSFGLSIRLPNEAGANDVIQGDIKLISFNYFFTRKVMFMSHSDAVAVFPGGFGTQDELFECLTLMQTGKTIIMPIVLLEGDGGFYWDAWEDYLKRSILQRGLIGADDHFFYFRTASIDDAIEHIERFYHRFHSYRYVRDTFVMRLKTPLTAEQVEILNQEFKPLVKSGKIEQRGAFEEENEFLELPRLAFEHTRSRYALVRQLIDRINNFPDRVTP